MDSGPTLTSWCNMRELHETMKTVAMIQADQAHTCAVPFCGAIRTLWDGPGKELCDDHRGRLKEYGGLAVLDKLYSFHREYLCACCGQDVRELAERHHQMLHPGEAWAEVPAIRKNEIYRTLMDVDHKDGNHENNHPDNLQTLCKFCHGVKTVMEQDSVNRKYQK